MKAPIFGTPSEEELLNAQNDPVTSLFNARQRFKDQDRSYRTVLYAELAVTYAAHEALIEDVEKWADFVQRAGEVIGKTLPEEPTVPQSLHFVVEYVFSGKQSPNRAYKFARALEILRDEGLSAEAVADRLKADGIDRLYYGANERLPRRGKPVTAKAAIGEFWSDVENLESRESCPDEDAEDAEEQRDADQSPPPPRPPVATRLECFDPERTLFVDCEPDRLQRALNLKKGEKGVIKFQCTGADAKGWKVLSAYCFEPPRVCRRLFGLSYAAMAGSSSIA